MGKLFPALRDKDSARMLRRVTQPPHIAGLLAFIEECLQYNSLIIKYLYKDSNTVSPDHNENIR